MKRIMTKLQNNFLMKEQTIRSTIWGHHFIFLNCLLALVTGYAYVYGSPQTESFISFVYLIAAWLGQISFLGFLVFLVVFFPLTFIGNFKVYRIISIIVAFLCHMLLLVDAKVFLSLKVHMTWSVVSLMIRDLTFNTGLNFNFMFIAIPVVVGLELLFAKLATREIYRQEVRHNYFPTIVISILTVCFISSHCFYIWADATSYEKITNLRSVFPAHYPMTAKSFLSNHGWIDDISSDENGSSTSNISYPLAEIKYTESQEQKNILTIFINGLSYSDLNIEDTPNLMKLKIENLSFENHYLPYSKLYNNLFASWFGLPIQYEDIFVNHSVDNIAATVMQKEEYLMRGFISALKSGVDERIAKMTGLNSKKLKRLPSDSRLLRDVKEFMTKNQDHKMALTLCLNSLLNLDKEDNFKNQLKVLDSALGQFMDEFNQSDLAQKTMVIISSAHGNKFIPNTEFYSRKQQRVPFIVISPDAQHKGVAKDVLTSSFDINPTIAVEILGITTPCVNYGIGEDVLTLKERDYIPTTHNNMLLLITNDAVTVYKRNGKVVTDTEGVLRPTKPDLENLIRAMRDFNRFKK